MARGSDDGDTASSGLVRRFISHLRDNHYVEISPETEQQWKKLKKDYWTDDEPTSTATTGLVVGLIAATSFLLGVQANRLQRQWPWRRFLRVTDIPVPYFGPTAPYLRGRVVSVSDGDTVRFRHAPTWFHRSTILGGADEKLSEVTLPLRICSIDTPETAKFGKPGQPYGNEAKEHLMHLVQDRIVECQLRQTDQYGRAVALVRMRHSLFFWKRYYVDELMLKAGWAEVYTGSGAVYGRLGSQDAYLKLMQHAQSKRLGMWEEQGSDEPRESAAAYKARLKSTR